MDFYLHAPPPCPPPYIGGADAMASTANAVAFFMLHPCSYIEDPLSTPPPPPPPVRRITFFIAPPPLPYNWCPSPHLCPPPPPPSRKAGGTHGSAHLLVSVGYVMVCIIHVQDNINSPVCLITWWPCCLKSY